MTTNKKITNKVLRIKTKYGSYRCVFGFEKDMGGYAVETQGLSGAISWGKTIEEAKLMIVEAIEGAIEADIVAGAEKRDIVQIKNNKWYLAVV